MIEQTPETPQDKSRILYDALSKNPTIKNLPEYDSFTAAMLDSSKRRVFYDALSRNPTIKNIPDFNGFSDIFATPTPQVNPVVESNQTLPGQVINEDISKDLEAATQTAVSMINRGPTDSPDVSPQEQPIPAQQQNQDKPSWKIEYIERFGSDPDEDGITKLQYENTVDFADMLGIQKQLEDINKIIGQFSGETRSERMSIERQRDALTKSMADINNRLNQRAEANFRRQLMGLTEEDPDPLDTLDDLRQRRNELAFELRNASRNDRFNTDNIRRLRQEVVQATEQFNELDKILNGTAGEKMTHAAIMLARGTTELPAGFFGGVATLSKMIDDLFTDDGKPKDEYASAKYAQAIRDFAENTFQGDERMMGKFWSDVAAGTGSMVSYMLLGMLTGGAGAGLARAGGATGAAVRTAGTGAGQRAAIISAGSSGMDRMYDEVFSATGDEEKAKIAGALGIGPGVLQVANVSRLLGKWDQALGGKIRMTTLNHLKEAGISGLNEAIVETLGEAGFQLIASIMTEEDIKLFDEWQRTASVAGTAGALTGFMNSLAMALMTRGKGGAMSGRSFKPEDPGPKTIDNQEVLTKEEQEDGIRSEDVVPGETVTEAPSTTKEVIESSRESVTSEPTIEEQPKPTTEPTKPRKKPKPEPVKEEITPVVETPPITPVTPTTIEGEPALTFRKQKIDSIEKDVDRFQNRDTEFSEATVENIVSDYKGGRLNLDNIPPILVWKDPTDGKTYVVGGHSRLEAFRRLGIKEIQTQELVGLTEAQARQRGREDNALGTSESVIEQSKLVRDWRDSGMSKAEIKRKSEQLFKNNARLVGALSALNPNGKVMAGLRALEKNEGDDRTKAQNFAKYIGEARLRNPQLTDSHETELYNYLLESDNANTKTQRDFLGFVDRIVGRNTFMGEFDSTKPLNIKGVKPLTTIETEYAQRIKEARSTLEIAQKAFNDKVAEVERRRSAGENLNDIAVESSLRKLRDQISLAQREVIKLETEAGRVKEGARNQGGLFGEETAPVQEPKTKKEELVDDIKDFADEFGGNKEATAQELGSAETQPEFTSVRDLVNLDPESNFASGLLASALQVGDTFKIGDKSYTVERRTKNPKLTTYDTKTKNIDGVQKSYKGQYVETGITIVDDKGKKVTVKIRDNWVQNGTKMLPMVSGGTAWNNLTRDIEGSITTDLINENNRFHKNSDVFNKVQQEIDRINSQINKSKPEKPKSEVVAKVSNMDVSPEGYTFREAGPNKFVVLSDELDTRDIKKTLKELGGKWDKSNKGWAFPISKAEEIAQAIEQNIPTNMIHHGSIGKESMSAMEPLSDKYKDIMVRKQGENIVAMSNNVDHVALLSSLDAKYNPDTNEFVLSDMTKKDLLDIIDAYDQMKANNFNSVTMELSSTQQPVSVPNWVKEKGETTRGRNFISRIRKDNKGTSIGLRTIIDYLNEVADTEMRSGKSQTSKRHPAHYNPLGHLIRSRVLQSVFNFHEAAHGISTLLRNENKRWQTAKKPTATQVADLISKGFINKDLLSKARAEADSKSRKKDSSGQPIRGKTWDQNVASFIAKNGVFVKGVVEDVSSPLGKEALKMDITDDLIAITQQAGGKGIYASAKSAEEGFAEFIRMYIMEHGELDPALVSKIESYLLANHPKIYRGLRDTARMYYEHSKRDFAARVNSRKHDKGISKPKKEARREARERFLYRYLSVEQANDALLDKIFRTMAEVDINVARDWRKSIKGTKSDILSSWQTIYSIKTEVARALQGDKNDGGVRIFATAANNEGTMTPSDVISGIHDTAIYSPKQVKILKAIFENLGVKDIVDAMRKIGFNISSNATRHGEYLNLSNVSMDKIRRDVGWNKWDDFKTYGQYKTALYRLARFGRKYPGVRDTESPAEAQKFVNKMERDNPDWKDHYEQVNDYMRQLLLIQAISGEKSPGEVLIMSYSHEYYWPLNKVSETQSNVQSTPKSKGKPGSGVKADTGSELAFADFDDVVRMRTNNALEAYYMNRYMMSVRSMISDIQKDPKYNKRAKYIAQRMMMPLKLDTKMVATLAKSEAQKAIADYLNQELQKVASESSDELAAQEAQEMLDAGGYRAEDIDMVWGGMPIYRSTDPNLIQVVAPFENGQRKFYQIGDPLLFDLVTRDKNPKGALKEITEVLYPVVEAFKRPISHNILFSLRQLIGRNIPQQVIFAEHNKQLIPAWNTGVAIMNRVTGNQVSVSDQSFLLSLTFNRTTKKEHATMVDNFLSVVKEGVYDEYIQKDYEQGNYMKPLLGQLANLAVKPIDIMHYMTAQREASVVLESIPREGAMKTELDLGFPTEVGVRAYQRETGNFASYPGSATAHSLYKIAGYINPAMQTFYQEFRKMFFDPDPKVIAQTWAAKIPIIMMYASAGAALNILLTLAGAKDEEEEERRVQNLRERPWNDRAVFKPVGTIFKLPFGYGISGAAESYAWNMTESYIIGNEMGSKEAAKVVLSRLKDYPTNPIEMLNPYIRTALELGVNYNFFYGEKIVPPWLESMYPYNPEFRYYHNTPMIYRNIGEFMNVSPLKVQYAIRSYMSRSTDQFVTVLDKIDKGEKVELSDYPFIGGAFQREFTGSYTLSVQKLTELNTEFQKIDTRIKHLMDSGKLTDEQFDRLMESRDQFIDASAAYKDVSTIRSSIRKLQNEIDYERNTRQPGYEDRIKEIQEIIDGDERYMVQVAREYFQFMKPDEN